MDFNAIAQWDISGSDGFGDFPHGEGDCGTLLHDLEIRLQSLGGEGQQGGHHKEGSVDDGLVTEFVWQSHNRCHCLPAREVRLPLPRLHAPLRLLELLDSEETAVRFAVMGEEDSFGAKIWPMAYVAAARLLDEDVRGRSVLELGCGTGLVSLAALAQGASLVLATDRSHRNLDLAKASARLNGLELEAELFDAAVEHHLPSAASPTCGNLKSAGYRPQCAEALPDVFDYVVLADVLYWPEDTVAFGRRVAEAYAAGSTVIVADGGRQRGNFFTSLRNEMASLGIDPLPEFLPQAAKCPPEVYGQLCSEVQTASSPLFCESPFEMVLRPKAAKGQEAGSVAQVHVVLLDSLD